MQSIVPDRLQNGQSTKVHYDQTKKKNTKTTKVRNNIESESARISTFLCILLLLLLVGDYYGRYGFYEFLCIYRHFG